MSNFNDETIHNEKDSTSNSFEPLELESSSEVMMEGIPSQPSSEVSSSASSRTESIISIIQKSPNYTIRPSRLATELGISVDDASAELCGLLAAVGGGPNGAYFTFDTKSSEQNQHPVMVFTFPQNFESKARLYQRKQSLYESINRIMILIVNGSKVMVAFGIFLSLLVLGIAMIIIVISSMIALLTMQHQQQRSRGSHHNQFQMQRLMGNLRQWLWYYYIFGGIFVPRYHHNNAGEEDDSIHPFLQEVSFILYNILSLGTGRGFLFSSMLFRRNRYSYRGTNPGRNIGQRIGSFFQRSSWRNTLDNGFGSRFRNRTHRNENDAIRESSSSSPSDENPFWGWLSMAIEFLFGPTPFWPEPTNQLKWKLRSEIIVSKPKAQISLEELSMYADDPPKNIMDISTITSSGLEIVAHFNGVPVLQDNTVPDEPSNAKSIFGFPELLSENDTINLSSTSQTYKSCMEDISPSTQVWYALLYQPSFSIRNGILGRTSSTSRTTTSPDSQTLYQKVDQTDDESSELHKDDTTTATTSTSTTAYPLPRYLQEQKHSLTNLSPKQFYACVFMGILNVLGMLWLRQSLSITTTEVEVELEVGAKAKEGEEGGENQATISKGTLAVILSSYPFLHQLCQWLVGILYGYSIFFICLPLIRLGVILVLNARIEKRNARRKGLSQALDSVME